MGRVGKILVGITVGGFALTCAIWMSLGIVHQWQVYRSIPSPTPPPRHGSQQNAQPVNQQGGREIQQSRVDKDYYLQNITHPSIGMDKQKIREVCGRPPDRTSSMTTATGTISTWTYRRGDPDRESWQALNTKCDGNVFGFNANGVLVVILD